MNGMSSTLSILLPFMLGLAQQLGDLAFYVSGIAVVEVTRRSPSDEF